MCNIYNICNINCHIEYAYIMMPSLDLHKDFFINMTPLSKHRQKYTSTFTPNLEYFIYFSLIHLFCNIF